MLGLCLGLVASAQERSSRGITGEGVGKAPAVVPGTLVIPAFSRINAIDHGRRAHTNVKFIAPALASPEESPPYTRYGYETPASQACIHALVTVVPGCNPNTTTATPSGGTRTIAIVDAYDDPEAGADLACFSAQFGLPFSPADFVKASSNTNEDLFTAVQFASNLVVCGAAASCPAGSWGRGQVSMSWGGEEFAGEKSYDALMKTPNVVYFAAVGTRPA